MIYEFKKGARVPAGVSAEDTARALLNIKRQYGSLTAEAVAGDFESSPDTHALRWGFTTDVDAGMHKLHVMEAGNIIRLVVVREVVPEQTEPVRAFVRVREDTEPCYEEVAQVIQEPDQLAQLIEQIEAEFDAIDRKRRELMALVRMMRGDLGTAA